MVLCVFTIFLKKGRMEWQRRNGNTLNLGAAASKSTFSFVLIKLEMSAAIGVSCSREVLHGA